MMNTAQAHYRLSPHISWLQAEHGNVYLLSFADPQPRILENTAAYIWQALLNLNSRHTAAYTAEDIAQELITMGLAEPCDKNAGLLEGIHTVIDQLTTCGALQHSSR